MFSAAALFMTIVLATRSDRETRQKDAAFIRAATLQFRAVLAIHRAAISRITEHGETLEAMWNRLARWHALGKTEEAMLEFKVKEFPTTEAVLVWINACGLVRDLMNMAAGGAADRSLGYLVGRLVEAEGLVARLESEATKRERGGLIGGAINIMRALKAKTQNSPKKAEIAE